MGGRTGKYFGEQAKANYSASKAEFRQAQKQHQSKAKFGKSATRLGGLSQDEIGSAPTMQFSEGFIGNFERALDPNEQERKRAGLGFGSSAQLG
tara:strand:+ start:428 stop:709 length:282 start_codon:yes stop_codon:yes gene_type:complete